MEDAVLQRFLNNGLIDVGGDDAKLEKLSQAAEDLAAILKNTPSKALNYSLIAFDPEAPEDDPAIQEALGVLQNRWPTYRNTFARAPVAVVRAMLLDALLVAGAEDDRVGICFAASARNALPLLRADNERNIWVDAVKQVERRIDARAEAEWAMPESITVPTMNYGAPELAAPQVRVAKTERSTLLRDMLAATGPQYRDASGTNVNSQGNPHWPMQNASQPWAWEYGNRSTAAIADAIDEVVGKIEISQPDLVEPFSKLTMAITSHVDSTLKAVSAATAGLQRRTNLLWWKESLYSATAQQSYRDLPVSVAAAQMALDLFRSVPLFSPASVSAFLVETVLCLKGAEAHQDRAVRELVAEAQTHESLAALRSAAAEVATAPAGRGPLLALIGHPSHANATGDVSFQRLTGVSDEVRLSPPAWAAWIFRELQAAKAASGSSPAKHGTVKKS